MAQLYAAHALLVLLSVQLSYAADPTCATSWSTEVNGTCCAWYCKGQDNSEDCSGCGGMGGSSCVRIDNEYCKAGDWKSANLGAWFPSRSTHYGFTSAGACGFGLAPNCYLGSSQFPDCASVPEALKTNVMAGMYAAPQGDYYSQVDDYLSCGECFEIACRDKSCIANQSIVVQLADSCPCEPNTKWCCGIQSHCSELSAATDGSSHCAINGGQWSSNSIHLDLSDPAFSMLTTGDKNKLGPAGIINTMARRVACPVVGNIFIHLMNGVKVASCYAGSKNSPCFYYFSYSVLNVAKLGGISAALVNASVLENGGLVQKWVSLTRNTNFSPARVQEQFNAFDSKNVAIFLPITFAFVAADGSKLVTKTFSTVPDCTTGYCYIDTGVQFA